GGPREHYARGKLQGGEITVFGRQDSSLLGLMAEANALAVIPPHGPARPAGSAIDVVRLDTNSEHP
ncbi:MAG: hypothetical protein AAFR50_01795, partial [Pseudomonadota bacterium]